MLTVYVDLISQPCRAVVIFCSCNEVPYNMKLVRITRGEHLTPQFQAINPLKLLPAIDDHGFRLAESHAIMKYIAATRNCKDSWYPSDAFRRASIDSLLDWHHGNLRLGATGLIRQVVLFPSLGRPSNPALVTASRSTLKSALRTLEDVWLGPQFAPSAASSSSLESRGSSGVDFQSSGASLPPGSCGRTALQPRGLGAEGQPAEQPLFLAGHLSPSIADLSLACELMQLQLLGPSECWALLSPEAAPRVRRWLLRVRRQLAPHFDAAHGLLARMAARRHPPPKEWGEGRAEGSGGGRATGEEPTGEDGGEAGGAGREEWAAYMELFRGDCGKGRL